MKTNRVQSQTKPLHRNIVFVVVVIIKLKTQSLKLTKNVNSFFFRKNSGSNVLAIAFV